MKKSMINEEVQNIEKQTVIVNRYWSCDICGGDSDTGCLYFDPTECPR